LDRRVAIKVLPMAAAMDGKQLQRFQLEAHAAACLHHTNIVPVHAVGCERGVPFYAMQFIDGRSLAQVIAELRRLERLRAVAPPPADILPPTLAVGAAAPASPDSRDHRPGEPAPAPASCPGPGTPAFGPHGEPPSGSSTRSREYIRTVARLGVQVAEALDHAH